MRGFSFDGKKHSKMGNQELTNIMAESIIFVLKKYTRNRHTLEFLYYFYTTDQL